MKTVFMKKPFHKVFVLALAVTTVFAACNKDDDGGFVPDPLTGEAGLRLAHVAPQLGAVDFYFAEEALQSDSLVFGDQTDYLDVEAIKDALIAVAGEDTLVNKELTFEDNKQYSLFLISDADGTNVDYLVALDDATAPGTGHAKVRFANLSADAGDLWVRVENAEDSLFTDVAFKSISSFTQVEAGTVTLEIVHAESEEIVATLAGVEMTSGKSYTIKAIGLVAEEDTDFAFEVVVTENK